MLWKMAFRNLGRNRGRTALSLAAVAVGVMLVVFAKGFIDGVIGSYVDNTVRLSLGHVRVVDVKYLKKERLLSLAHPVDGFAGEGYASVLRKVDATSGVVAAAPRIRFGALVSRGDKPETVMGVGIDPVREAKVAQLNRFLIAGRLPRLGSAEVLAGQRLLDKLHLRVGSRLTLVTNTAYGSLNGSTFRIVGAMVSGLNQLDESTLYLPLDEAQRFVDLAGGVTDIAVLAENETAAPQLAARLQAALNAAGGRGHYVAQSFMQADPLMGMTLVAKAAYNWIYVVILVLASFVLMNTMLMIVNERTREIGALGALGFSRRQISLLFTLEGAAIGLLGSLAGAVAGGALTAWFAVTGIDLSKMMQGLDKSLLYPTRIYPTFSLGLLLFAVVLGTLIPTLAAYWPARRAGRLHPSEAMRAN